MPLIISQVNLALLNGIPGHVVKHFSHLNIGLHKKTHCLLHLPSLFLNTFLFDFSTGRSEMSAGRCRLHSVWSDPFHLGALAYFLGGVFLPCPKPYKRSSKWNLLVVLLV